VLHQHPQPHLQRHAVAREHSKQQLCSGAGVWTDIIGSRAGAAVPKVLCQDTPSLHLHI
jgi:hypothetical protein